AVQHVMDNWSYVYTTTYGYAQGAPAGPGNVMVASTFPDGERVTYSYDAGGAQQAITTTPQGGPPQPVVLSVTRNVRGQTTSVLYGNGVSQNHTYNDATDLRLSSITTGTSGELQHLAYAFDPNGNVTAVTDSADPTQDASNAYDSLNQLTGGTWAYGYD